MRVHISCAPAFEISMPLFTPSPWGTTQGIIFLSLSLRPDISSFSMNICYICKGAKELHSLP